MDIPNHQRHVTLQAKRKNHWKSSFKIEIYLSFLVLFIVVADCVIESTNYVLAHLLIRFIINCSYSKYYLVKLSGKESTSMKIISSTHSPSALIKLKYWKQLSLGKHLVYYLKMQKKILMWTIWYKKSFVRGSQS